LSRASSLLPFVLVLLTLGWALGTLARSTPGGNLLVNSYWLLYVLYLVPFLALGALVLLAVFIVWNLKDLSDGLGSGIARKLKKRKKHWAVRMLIFFYSWVFVLVFLEQHCGGFVCKPSGSNNIRGLEATVVSAGSSSNLLAVKAAAAGLSGVLRWDWFLPMSIVLLIASSAVMTRSVLVAFRESRMQAHHEIRIARLQGLAAVQEAIKIVSIADNVDPRVRIVMCFERLVATASQLGAAVSPDQTAREIEMSIRHTFLLQRPATSSLVQLFEEARYSMHPMVEEDASKALEYLTLISDELKTG
jgi:hypothetical protein